jgi:hypothetical protein
MYIVYLSHGEYSNYSVDFIMMGKKDPEEIVNKYVKYQSNGLLNSLPEVTSYERNHRIYSYPNKSKEEELAKKILNGVVKELENNGFKKVEAKEVWLG